MLFDEYADRRPPGLSPEQLDEEERQRQFALEAAKYGAMTPRDPLAGMNLPSLATLPPLVRGPMPQMNAQDNAAYGLATPTPAAISPLPSLAPLSAGSDWREQGGARINDGFDALGNLLGTTSPSRMLDAAPGAGYTFHSGNTIMPIAHPSDANLAGEAQVARSMDFDRQYTPMLMQHAMKMSLLREQNAADLDKARIMTGGKEEANFNKSLALTGDARIPTPQALTEIRAMKEKGHLKPEDANNLIMQRLTSQRGPDGKSLIPLYDPRQGSNMSAVAAALTSKEAADIPDEAKRGYLETMGVSSIAAAKRLAELKVAGNHPLANWVPFMRLRQNTIDPRVLHGADLFSKDRLPPEQQNEFDVLSRLYGSN